MEIKNSQPSYQIRIQGHLQEKWIEWLNGSILDMAVPESGAPETILLVSLPDQAALRGFMNKIWDLNLIVLSVQQTEPSA